MKDYDVLVEIKAVKVLTVTAESEDDAIDKAYEICETTTIPILPDDCAEIVVDSAEEPYDFDWMDDNYINY